MARPFSSAEANDLLVWYEGNRAKTDRLFEQALNRFDEARTEALEMLRIAMMEAIENIAAVFISNEPNLNASQEAIKEAAFKLARREIEPDETIKPIVVELFAIDKAKEQATPILSEYSTRLDRAVQNLHAVVGPMKWFVSGQRTRRDAEAAYKELFAARETDLRAQTIAKTEALLSSAKGAQSEVMEGLAITPSMIESSMEEVIPLPFFASEGLINDASDGKISRLLEARESALQLLQSIGNSNTAIAVKNSVPDAVRALCVEQGIINKGSGKALLSTKSRTKASEQLVLAVCKQAELERIKGRSKRLYSLMESLTAEDVETLQEFQGPVALVLAGEAKRVFVKNAYDSLSNTINGKERLIASVKSINRQYKAVCSMTEDAAWKFFIEHPDEVVERAEKIAPGWIENERIRRKAERMRLRSEREQEKLSLAQVPEKKRPDKPETVEATARPSVIPIHVNQFLVRRSYGSHNTDGHKLESVKAVVGILPKGSGDIQAVEFNGYYCPKCQKYFLLDDTYFSLKRKGYICCRVIEERELHLRRGLSDGPFGELRDESIAHQYGYTVSQQRDLSEAERRDILSFMIANRIQSTQEIAKLLEWLIHSGEGRKNMRMAVEKWRSDLQWVRRYNKPTRRVIVDSIFARI